MIEPVTRIGGGADARHENIHAAVVVVVAPSHRRRGSSGNPQRTLIREGCRLEHALGGESRSAQRRIDRLDTPVDPAARQVLQGVAGALDHPRCATRRQPVAGSAMGPTMSLPPGVVPTRRL